MITCVSIAKNETNNLERFFDSLDGLHDRLVLVDTGSKDCTKAMATKLGAEVHEIPFTNFGDTRNRAAEIAKDSDWLVMFDCDEVLYDAPKLRESFCLYRIVRSGHRLNRPATAIPFAAA